MSKNKFNNKDPQSLGLYLYLMERAVQRCVEEDQKSSPRPDYLKLLHSQLPTLPDINDAAIKGLALSLSLRLNNTIGDKQLENHLKALKFKNQGTNAMPAAYMSSVEGLVRYAFGTDWNNYCAQNEANIPKDYFSGWNLPSATDAPYDEPEGPQEPGPVHAEKSPMVLYLSAAALVVCLAGYSFSSAWPYEPIANPLPYFLMIFLHLIALAYQLLEIQPAIARAGEHRRNIAQMNAAYLAFLTSGAALYLTLLFLPQLGSLVNVANTFFLFLMYAFLETRQTIEKGKILTPLFYYLASFIWLAGAICAWDLSDKMGYTAGHLPENLGVLLMSLLNAITLLLLFSRMTSFYLKINRLLIVCLFVYACLQMKWDDITITAAHKTIDPNYKTTLLSALMFLKGSFFFAIGVKLFHLENLGGYFRKLRIKGIEN